MPIHPNRVVHVIAALAAFLGCESRSVIADDNAELEFLLPGVLQRVENLKSAEFTAIGAKSASGAGAVDLPQGEVRIHGAIEVGKLRFDYSEPAMIEASRDLAARIGSEQPVSRSELEQMAIEAASEPHDSPQEIVATSVETYFLRTPEKVSYWFNGQPTMFTGAPNSDVPSTIRRFDINALGMYGPLEFKTGHAAQFLVENYLTTPNCDVSDLGGGIHRVRFKFDNPLTSVTWQFDVDTVNGFTTTESKLTERNKKVGSETIKHHGIVEWANVGDAWVPEKVDIKDAVGDIMARLRLTFTYISVNEQLDASLFDANSIPLPDYGAIIDNSGAQPVVVRQPYQNLKRVGMPNETSGLRLVFVVFGIGGAAVFAVLASWLYRRPTRPRG